MGHGARWGRGRKIGVKGEVGEVRWRIGVKGEVGREERGRIGAEGGGGEGGEGKDWS